MRLLSLALGLVLASSPILSGGCGGGGSADQGNVEQARREGAVAAHHADEIHQLQREVSALKRERVVSTPDTAPPSTERVAETATGADSRIPASGTYVGQAKQRGAPARLNKQYRVEMTFSSTGSYVLYPSLHCGGSLRPLGFEGTRRIYEETITSGHCDNRGVWLVQVDSPKTLETAWSLPSASYNVTAVLER